ncbi:hypothetical protein BCR24_12225 [Enterococcus ureilyticus]|uniref:Uncharacterized protein n=1 Tax=Enterococcus ureilyticus TaxID=1131292 RepID=A0A1E5HEC1_9ENTE|nr:hypothetical protein [Enterococcus ureilyticus]MBM7689528.1 hypothetical protein [Enterococcus ureilyticus]MBO0446260.1 hypothetical protein [Enterococcus ureilyticus]OEG23283.1 hypothetical protein BCR24_12225 [Enterococcus ureilyticus]
MKKINSIVIYFISLILSSFIINWILVKIGVPDHIVWQTFAESGYKNPPKSYGFVLALLLSLFLLLQAEVYIRKVHPERRKNFMNPKQDMKLNLKSFLLIELVAIATLIPVFFILKSIIDYL